MKRNTKQYSELINYATWCRSMGISLVTGWRWRKKGWLKTLRIANHIYLERSEADRFLKRVREGEMAGGNGVGVAAH